jgi:hypothetical protein
MQPYLWKKLKILASISQNFMFYNIKILCHHVEHTLFYLWLKYEAILFLLILFW